MFLWRLDWNFTAVFRTIFSIMAGCLFIMIHLVILLLSHAAAVSISESIDLNAAVTPLHTAVMRDDWKTVYDLMRENVFAELPFFSFFETLFLNRSTLHLHDLLYDIVKALLSGTISYLLCRFNLLLSSKNNPILFSAVTSIWNSIGIFGGMLLVNYFRTYPSPVHIVMCIGSLLVSLILISILTFFNQNDIMKFSRIVLENIKILLVGSLDSLYYFLVSCFMIDILHPHNADPVSLILMILACACVFNLIYAHIKNTYLI